MCEANLDSTAAAPWPVADRQQADLLTRMPAVAALAAPAFAACALLLSGVQLWCAWQYHRSSTAAAQAHMLRHAAGTAGRAPAAVDADQHRGGTGDLQ